MVRMKRWSMLAATLCLIASCADTAENPGTVTDTGSGDSGATMDVATPPPSDVKDPAIEVQDPDKDSGKKPPDQGIKEWLPCTENADCPSSWCVETADGKTCTAGSDCAYSRV